MKFENFKFCKFGKKKTEIGFNYSPTLLVLL